MITLCLQEILQEKNVSIAVLSANTGIPEEVIQAYLTTEVFDFKEKSVEIHLENFRNIATKLNVSLLDLVKSSNKKNGYRFKVKELAENQGITLFQLSELLGMNSLVLEFYSTQIIAKKELESQIHFQNLTRISEALNCNSIDDLKIESYLPKINLNIEEILAEKNLDAKDLSILLGLPDEFVSLISNQLLYVDLIKENDLELAFLINKNVSFSREEFTLESRENRDIKSNLLGSGMQEIIGRFLCCALNRPCCR